MLLRRRMYGKDGSINADSYVQNGLVFQLDGIDWGGVAGHWKERKNNYDWYTPNSVDLHTEEDCMVLSGSNYFITDDIIPDYPSSSYSIEACFMLKGNGWFGISNFGASNVSFWGNSNSHFMWSKGSNIAAISQNNLYTLPVINNIKKVSVHAQNGDFYVNNTQITPTGTGTRSANGRVCIGTLEYNTASTYGMKGKLFAIRVYNRQLTAEEIQQNSEIDSLRFNIQ